MTKKQEPAFRQPLRDAIAYCGSQSDLERRSGIVQQTISWLLLRAERISAEHAVAIDRATDGHVPKHRLRPDLFEGLPARPIGGGAGTEGEGTEQAEAAA